MAQGKRTSKIFEISNPSNPMRISGLQDTFRLSEMHLLNLNKKFTEV